MKKAIFLLSFFTTSCTMFFSTPKFKGLDLKIINRSSKSIKSAKVFLSSSYDFQKNRKEGAIKDSVALSNILDSTSIKKVFYNKNNSLNEGSLSAEIILNDGTEIFDRIYGFDCLIGCKANELEGSYTIEVFDNEIKTTIALRKWGKY